MGVVNVTPDSFAERVHSADPMHAVDAALWLLGVADRGEEVEVAAQVALPGGNLGIPMDLTVAMRTARLTSTSVTDASTALSKLSAYAGEAKKRENKNPASVYSG